MSAPPHYVVDTCTMMQALFFLPQREARKRGVCVIAIVLTTQTCASLAHLSRPHRSPSPTPSHLYRSVKKMFCGGPFFDKRHGEPTARIHSMGYTTKENSSCCQAPRRSMFFSKINPSSSRSLAVASAPSSTRVRPPGTPEVAC